MPVCVLITSHLFLPVAQNRTERSKPKHLIPELGRKREAEKEEMEILVQQYLPLLYSFHKTNYFGWRRKRKAN